MYKIQPIKYVAKCRNLFKSSIKVLKVQLIRDLNDKALILIKTSV